MGFAKLTSSKEFNSFNSFEIGEFFRWNGDIYIKSDASHAINLSREGVPTEFDFPERVEDVQIELKVL